MLGKIKLALRIKNEIYDEEILSLIDACKIDLRLSGVNEIDTNDKLTERAITLYCKGNFGYDDNSERYTQAYNNLKIAMALSGDYGVGINV